MRKRRFILENLHRSTLLDLAYAFEIPGLTGKRKADILATLSRKRTLEPEAILQQLSRDDLKSLCEAAGLDTTALIDDAIFAVERDNPSLKGKIPRNDRLLVEYGYPPDLAEGATQLVLKQVEVSAQCTI